MDLAVIHRIGFLFQTPAGPCPCTAQLGYTPAEPWAVTIDFARHLSVDGRPVRWCFARDLLIQGTSRTSGQGDVRIGPLGSQHTLLELRSPLATAALTCPTAALDDFLQATFRLVAPGHERPRHDWDTLTAALTARQGEP